MRRSHARLLHPAASSLLLPLLLLAPPALAGDLKGRLLVDGKPAAGVTVAAVPHETPFAEARRQARGEPSPAAPAQTASGADGAFVLRLAAEPGKPARDVRLTTRGGGTVPARSLDVFSTGEDADGLELSLTKAQLLVGKVTGPDGAPLVGATVTLLPGRRPREADSRDTELLPVTVPTGPDGTFRLEAAGPAANRLSVHAPGFAPAERSGLRPGAVRAIALTPGVSVSGRVVRADRKTPVKGALVRVEGPGATRWVETGDGGTFRAADAPKGRVRFVADADLDGQAEKRGVGLPLVEGALVELVLSPPAAIEGRAVDAKTLSSVPRVKVRGEGPDGVVVARTGPDGRYRLRPLRPGTYRVVGDEPRHVAYVKDDVAVAPGETRKVDLPLVLGATLSGKVVDEEGRPLAGASGRLSRKSEGGIAAFVREMRQGESAAFRSGADGTFKATRLTPGESLRLQVSHPEYESASVGGLALAPGSGRAGLTVTLRRGMSISGVVTDADEQPVPGAELELTRSRTFSGGRGGQRMQVALLDAGGSRPAGRTGADGRFELRGLAAGDWSLRVRKPGYATELVDPVKVGEGSPALSIVLGPGASISGRVVRKSGEGVEGVLVNVVPRGGSSLRPRDFTENPTGPDGIFVVDGLRAGESYELATFRPSAAGPGPGKKDVLAPSENVELVLPGGGAVKGTVVEAETLRPVGAFSASTEPDRGGARGGMVIRMAARAGRLGGSDGARRFESEDGGFLLEDVPPGKWEVVVEAKGYQTGRAGGIVVEEGATREGVEVKLSRGAVLRGRVTDARSGRAIPDASVGKQLSGEGGAGMPRIPGLGGDELTTDADGRFEIEGIAPGTYKLTVTHGDYAEASETVEVTERGGNAEVKLSKGGTVGGTVVSEARRPVAGVEVTLAPVGEGGFGAMLGGAPQTTSDEVGRFRFEHLTAGRYTASAARRGSTSPPVDVVLQAGEARDDLTLVLTAGSTIAGTVRGLPESALAGVLVSASGADAYSDSARTDAAGTFRLEGVPAGSVSLRAQAGDFRTGTRSASAEVTVPEGVAEVPAEVVFEGTATLSGRVTKGGRGVPDAFVNASRRGSPQSASGRTDEEGRYRLEGLEDGTYTVFVTPGFSGSFGPKSETVEVSGDATLDVAIPSARLAGSVVESGTKRPLADAQVDLSSGETGRPGLTLGAATDSNGRFDLSDLEEKAYTLTVRKPGYQFEKRPVVPAEQGTDDLVVELTRGEGIGIEVKDGLYGVPLRSLLVRASDAQLTAVFTGTVPLDSDGRGEVPSLQPGRYTLFVDATGYAPRTLEGVSAPQPLVPVFLTPGGSLDVLSGPETLALPNARGRLVQATGTPYALTPFSPEGWLPLASQTRRIPNVAPGSYTFAVEGGAAKPVTITEGGRAAVELP